jgi:hypothetical protein
MLKFITRISLIILAMLTQISVSLALQISSPTTLLPGNPSMDLTQVDPSTAGSFIASIIAWLLGITAVLAVLAVTYAGIQMILAT